MTPEDARSMLAQERGGVSIALVIAMAHEAAAIFEHPAGRTFAPAHSITRRRSTPPGLRARRYNNDNAYADRRASPGRNPGRGRQGNRIEELDFESAEHKQLKGNIYLAK